MKSHLTDRILQWSPLLKAEKVAALGLMRAERFCCVAWCLQRQNVERWRTVGEAAGEGGGGGDDGGTGLTQMRKPESVALPSEDQTSGPLVVTPPGPLVPLYSTPSTVSMS